VRLLEWDRAVAQQLDVETRRTVLDIQHEACARQADRDVGFELHEGAPGQTPVAASGPRKLN
jgi:hypothetical protein